MPDLPRPVSTDQHYYARIADLLGEQNDLLRQVLAGRQDDQPDPTTDGPQPVELREPNPPIAPAAADSPARRPTGRRAAKKGT
ncbi:hypothetical protein [Dactylosporangium salmoneum]|uniref:Transposase n=1 Tax=Dactylosporangium salmoneum TaxID=53361 RepID=A0ABN3G9B7_9ACTN